MDACEGGAETPPCDTHNAGADEGEVREESHSHVVRRQAIVQ